MTGCRPARTIGDSRLVGVISLCLILAPAAAWAQEVVPRGAPFAIAANPGADAPGGRPGIASDGNGFLTVWRDARNGSTHADDPYAARVTRDGVVLDPNGIRLSTSTADSEWPSVAFDGTHYLVVWTAPVGPSHYEIFGTIVATDGTIVASDVPITTAAYSLNRVVSIAFDGTNFLIAWRTWSGSHLRATRVSRVGGTLTSLDGASGFLIASLGGDFYPWVTFGSGQFLVAWHGWGVGLDIFAARVTTAGVVLDPEGFVVSASPSGKDHVSVAASGSNYLITYRDAANEDVYRNARGYAVRVSPAGTVLDTTPILIAEDVSWGGPQPVVFDGTNYVVMYQATVSQNARYMDIMGRRFSPAGVPQDPTPFPISTSFHAQGWLPMFGYGNGRFLAAWQDTGRVHICQSMCVGGQILETVPASASSSTIAPLATGTDAELPADTGWQAVTSPVGVAIHSVDALDDSAAYAGSENTLLLRYTGTSWSTWNGSFVGTDFGLWANAPDDVAAAGWSFGVKRFNGTQWSWTNLDAQRGLAQLAQGLWYSGRNNAFVVGTQGRAIRFDGANWQSDPTGVVLDLWDVWGSAANNVFAVGERGTVLHWNGSAWSHVSGVPTRQNLNAVWGTSATNVFAVGDFGTILHFDGVSWATQSSGTAKHLTGIAGLSPTAIFAVGFGGTILRYNGVSWQAEASGTTNTLLDVAVGGDTVWAVGDYGTIRRNVIDGSHCARTLDRAVVSASAGGGLASVTLSTNCAWRSWSNAPWIVLDSAANGIGDAHVSFTVQPNVGGSARTGTLSVGTRTVTVTQDGATGCTFTLNPTSANHGANAASGSVAITASGAACAWTAASNATWLTITSATTGTGSATVLYSVLANTTTASRGGTLTLAGMPFSVSQAGASSTVLPPSNLTASVVGNTVTTAWVTPAGGVAPTAFVLEGGVNPGEVLASLPIAGAATSFTFTAPDGVFFIRLHALAGGARSAASNEVRIAVNVPMPPAAPVDLTGEAFGSHLRLAWRNRLTEGAPTSIMLDVSGSLSLSLPLPLAESFFFSGMPPGTYTLAVRAANAWGSSAPSNVVTLTFPAACIAAATPGGFAVTRSGNLISASWSPGPGGPTPTGYVVTVTGAASLTVPIGQTSISGTAGPGSYTISVTATHPCGDSLPTSPRTIVIP